MPEPEPAIFRPEHALDGPDEQGQTVQNNEPDRLVRLVDPTIILPIR
jgi:hypothetical protein